MKVLIAFLSRSWVQQLLALNVSFYGFGLATLLSGSTIETIDAHCPACNVNFVQRMLALSNATLTKNTVCFGNASSFEFAVEEADQPPVSVVFHVDSRDARHSIPLSCVNVCNVVADRLGVSFLDQANHPAPFANALAMCVERRCIVVPRSLLPGTPLHNAIHKVLSNGWTIENMDVRSVPRVDECPICRCASADALQTTCGHEFCTACWTKHWETTVARNTLSSTLACPMCRAELPLWSTMVA